MCLPFFSMMGTKSKLDEESGHLGSEVSWLSGRCKSWLGALQPSHRLSICQQQFLFFFFNL